MMKRRQNQESLNCPVPQKFHRSNSPKKLRLTAVNEFLKCAKLPYSPFLDYFDTVLRYSLISQKFFDKIKEIYGINADIQIFLNEQNNGYYESGFEFKIKSNTEKKQLNAFQAFLNFIKCQKISIQFAFNDNDIRFKFDRELIQTIAYFFRGLKNVTFLQKIDVNFFIGAWCDIKKPIVALLLDLLPKNKALSIESIYDISSLVKNRKEPLECVKIHRLAFKECTAQMFRTNTRTLVFWTDKDNVYTFLSKFHYLSRIGPFSPNPSLKHLKIGIDLLQKQYKCRDKNGFYDIKSSPIDAEEWNNKFLPWCRKSFEYLKVVNENLEFLFKTFGEVNVLGYHEIIGHYTEQIHRAKSIVDMAQEFGFEIESFYVETIFMVSHDTDTNKALENFIDATKNVMESNQFKDSSFCSVEHKGIQIGLNYWFENRDFDSDKESGDESSDNE